MPIDRQFEERLDNSSTAFRDIGANAGTVNEEAYFGEGQGIGRDVEIREDDGLDYTEDGRARDAQTEAMRSMVADIVQQMFEALFWAAMPEELASLSFTHAGQTDIEGGQVATIKDYSADDQPELRTIWETVAGSLRVKGTMALGKGIFPRGYSRANLDDDWWGDDGPTAPDANDYDVAAGFYSKDESGYHALLPTWDYPRRYW